MELRSLRYFLAVAKEENMTEAANILHVTQPTLSRQMADLEREFGKRLFIRTNRKTILTEDGIRLRQRAKEILSLVTLTEEEIKSEDSDLSGCIHVGAGETHSMHILLDVLADMHKDYPKVTFELFTGNADTVEEKLVHGLIDVGVFIEPFSHVDQYEHLYLPEKDIMGIVTRRESPWGQLREITPEILKTMPLLTSSRSVNEAFSIENWSSGKIHADDLQITGTFDLMGNASLLVETGIVNLLGISNLLPIDNKHLCFVPLSPAVKVSSIAAWKKNRLYSRAVNYFLKELKQKVAAYKENS